MAVVALARVIHDKEMEERTGWSKGYRLIEIDTERVADYSDEVVAGVLQRNREAVENLGEIDGKPVNKYAGTWDNPPDILVGVDEERMLKSGRFIPERPVMFRMKIMDLASYNMLEECIRVCDIFGKNIKTVSGLELTRVMNRNKIDLFGERADECVFDMLEITNKPAREYNKRNAMLGVPRLILFDTVLDDGATVMGATPDIGDTVVFPEFVTAINMRAFNGETSIQHYKFGPNVKVIGAGAFRSGIMQSLELNEGLQEIRVNAIDSTVIKGTLELPRSLIEFSNEAASFSHLGSLVINSEKLVIGSRAFFRCELEHGLVIGKTVKHIDCSARTFQFTKCEVVNIKSEILSPQLEWLKCLLSETNLYRLILTEDAAVKLLAYLLNDKRVRTDYRIETVGAKVSAAIEWVRSVEVKDTGNKLKIAQDIAEGLIRILLTIVGRNYYNTDVRITK